MTTPAIPLACNLAALTAEQRARHAELWKRVLAGTPTPQRTRTGFAFPHQPSSGLARELAELAALEMLCCPFLRISVTFEPGGGPLSLRIDGNEDAQPFLNAAFKRA